MNSVTNFVLLPLLLITFCSAAGSLPILLTYLPNYMFLIILFVTIIIGICIKFDKTTFSILTHCKNNVKTITMIIIIIIVFWQIALVFSLSSRYNYDPNMLLQTAFNGKHFHYGNYFSKYPNNFLLLLIFRSCKVLFHINNMNTFIVTLSTFNIVLVDLTCIFIYKTAENLFSKKVAYFSSLIFIAIFGISPNIVIVYSDIYSAFLCSMMIYSYSEILTSKNYIWPFLFGISTTLCYLIKPSTLIFLIALLIIMILRLEFKNIKHNSKHYLKMALLILIGFSIIYTPINYYMYHNNFVKIERNQKTPITEFMAMGMFGKGGVNSSDFTKNLQITHTSTANKYFTNEIKQRGKSFGSPVNYLKFLIRKQINNTQSGLLGWGSEGTSFMYNPIIKSRSKIVIRLRNTFMNKHNNITEIDPNIHGYSFLPQILWTITIILLMLGIIKNINFSLNVFSLTLLGGLTFLLLFEGGRSRYLIQYIPIISIIAGNGLNMLAKESVKKFV